MILEIERYNINRIVDDKGNELNPIDLQKSEYQQANKYWDKYNLVNFLLSFVELRDKPYYSREYPFRQFLDYLIEEKTEWGEGVQEEGTISFDLHLDYKELIRIAKENHIDDYWKYPHVLWEC